MFVALSAFSFKFLKILSVFSCCKNMHCATKAPMHIDKMELIFPIAEYSFIPHDKEANQETIYNSKSFERFMNKMVQVSLW